MEDIARSILQLLKLSERLKKEMRHSWLSDGRRESVAEHTWQMSLLAMLCARHLEHPINIERALKMIIVHDLVEAEAGDVPFFESSDRQDSKQARESAAMAKIREMLPTAEGQEIYDLWHEFEARQSAEAKFVKALDNLEVQIQHNVADLSTWEEVEYGLVYTKMDRHCSHDSFLNAVCGLVKRDAEKKMVDGGVDVESVKRGARG